jgi:antitoxin component of RelBE/YafQ-DinJ toxin-antitoxin module
MSSQSSSKKEYRLSCRMDSELMEWVKDYTDRRGITITQLIDDFFRRLRRNAVNRDKVEIEQI